jgi:hypothetical protein
MGWKENMGQVRTPKSKKARIRSMVRKGKYKGHFLASCYGKIRFDDYESAKLAATALGSGATPYKCKYSENGVHYHRGRKAWK